MKITINKNEFLYLANFVLSKKEIDYFNNKKELSDKDIKYVLSKLQDDLIKTLN